ncbi:hypothetical protein MIS45_05610 [Wielerella bovis]|uniref:hypothetical protein n=1 Tax=Wielerella bovis TaxID=2917790 RepID=UPI002018522E|nr:hypothetical protein [Wielerella bovis]ULJ70295.1 hypothetical protein MIS45_05610 [Wielerella bovis]
MHPRVYRSIIENLISGCLNMVDASTHPTQVIYFHRIFNFSYPEFALVIVVEMKMQYKATTSAVYE